MNTQETLTTQPVEKGYASKIIKEFLVGKSLDNPGELLRECTEQNPHIIVYPANFKRLFEKAGGVWENVKTISQATEEEVETVESPKGIVYPAWKGQHLPVEARYKGFEVLIAGFDQPVKGVIKEAHFRGDAQWPDCDGYTISVPNSPERHVGADQVKLIGVSHTRMSEVETIVVG